MAIARAHVLQRRCPGCQRLVADDASEARCPYCGRWLRLPRSPWLESLNETPALATSIDFRSGTPWKELSPSIGFVVAVLLVCVGLHFTSIGIVGLGGALIPVCLVAAAVLEFRADRAASGHGADAMGALNASSDWAAIGQRRRPRA